MTNELRPHPEYKDSGLHWLGQIPAHWDIRASKRMFTESVERARPEDEQLSATQSHGVILQAEFERIVGRKVVRILHHLDKRKHVENDDFVISMRSFQGGLERAWSQGAIRSSYVVLRPGKGIHVPYFAHLFKSHPYIQALRRTSEFIRDGQDLTFGNFCQVPLPVVPMNEQKAIANYLDANAAVVRRFVRNRRRVIEVLNEQKRAIINRAVARGLAPNVPLRPSGIDWLGDIPEHWIVKPLKRWVSINERVLPETTDPEYAFDYLDIGCVGTGRLVGKPSRILFGDAPSRARRILQRGDTIISTVRTYLRAVWFVAEDVSDLVASTGFAVLSPREGVVPEYLGLTLQSDPFINRVTANSIGIAYPAIAETRLGTFHVAMPPDAREQRAIVEQVRDETAALTTWIERTQREIDLVGEYRTRLIADVVTGKLDVRGLALPESAPGDEITEAGPEELDESMDDEELPEGDEPELLEEEAGSEE
jgi:type I restriction enzyme, S subunit